MRNRYKKLSDYGIPKEIEDKLYTMVRHLDEDEMIELSGIALAIDEPVIANKVVQSLTSGASYDVLNAIEYIPLKRDDFYAHRRKVLAEFYNVMVESGKW